MRDHGVAMDAPMAKSDPLLASVVADRHSTTRAVGPDRPWRYANEWDASFRPDDPEGGFNRYGWNETDQAAFETIWPAGGNRWIDELIEDYHGMWPWLITRVLQGASPGAGSRSPSPSRREGHRATAAWGLGREQAAQAGRVHVRRSR